ncbi:roadblock/LC7 domain-containing protein [candidate division KSB1 bacterium]|nr:roadblock/LC7 domain-containing protein [candidate division KSB1 bacterium]
MEMGSGGNGHQMILTGEMYKTITDILSELLIKTRARIIVFADIDGHAITQKGSTTGFNVNALAALAAGNYSATNEISRIIGEHRQFKFIFHEGTETNMYTCSVGDNFLLVVVFDVSIALGMIRIFTARTIRSLEELLEKHEKIDDKTSEFLDIEFSTLLNQEFDKTFDKYDF